MEIREGSLFFPRTVNRGPQTAVATVRFPRLVERAVACIAGYSATFDDEQDQHLGRLQIQLETSIDTADNQNVNVHGTFGLHDWPGNWDNPYTGTVEFTVLVDLAPVVPPRPGAGDARGDLIITDMEITQAIQHFRSGEHLASPNIFPDNSIRLISDKPTGVRVYVDYDSTSGLLRIARLTGELEVSSASGMRITLPPVAPITPRRDNQIDRGNTGHTLNFIIPENLCRDNVTFRCRVFDTADRDAFSETYEREVRFYRERALRIYAIAINYTGPDTIPGQPTSAPTQTDFVDTFAFTELLYPIPYLNITGYMTINYDNEIRSDINSGNCDKFGDLLNTVRDLRGDSTDIYYGLLNLGVDTGSVGGCGGAGGAGAGIIGQRRADGTMPDNSTAAHEVAHALGRQHAPCDNVTRCARPGNTDDDYPNYSGYDSDSIGEYGFDTRIGKVLSPAIFHDFMGYSRNRWVGPYTFKALLSRIPSGSGGSTGGSPLPSGMLPIMFDPATNTDASLSDNGEWIPMKTQHLFLSLSIDRNRSVGMRAAFHFPAWPQPYDPVKTPFVVEFRDDEDNVLLSECLYDKGNWCGSCGENHIWPKWISQGVPYDPNAGKLVILEKDEVIYEQDIPEPPEIELACTNADQEDDLELNFTWEVLENEGSALWYLLQWRGRDGNWRGAAPRTQEQELSVPKKLFQGETRLALRLLATSGIATGMAVWEGEIALQRPASPYDRQVRLKIQGAAIDDETGSYELNPTIRVSVMDYRGRSVDSPDLIWYDGKGGELGRGRSLNLRVLPVGVNQLRAVVLNTGQEGGSAAWLVERTSGNRYLLHRGTVSYPDPDC